MAEALGVAASAISILTLTAQIIDSIDKLRALHTFVKTASIEFEDLLAEIEIIQAVLRMLTPEMLTFLNLPSPERRLQTFHQDLATVDYNNHKSQRLEVHNAGQQRYTMGLPRVAAVYGRLDMCRFLIENGWNIDQRDGNGISPISSANMFMVLRNTGPEDVPWICELYRLFITEAEETLFDCDSPTYGRWAFSGPADALASIQSYSFDGCSTLPLETRFRRVMAVNTTLHCNLSPDVLRVAMGGLCIDPAAYLLEDDKGITLLHKIAQAMGSALAVDGHLAATRWCPLLSDAISAHANLNHMTKGYYTQLTPLLYFIKGYSPSKIYLCRSNCWSFDSAVQLWVYMLKGAGIDLEIYGRAEESLLRSGYGTHSISTHGIDTRQSAGSAFGVSTYPATILDGHILGLQYGPNPEDWHLFVTNLIDELVGAFWEMVERSLEVMPGTWID
ncbi:hypothetical protein BJX62DRAFT_240878 [Aspergillus germanicus]